MTDSNYNIPMIYQRMSERGLINPENYLWFNEMEWMSIKEIKGYEYEEGESRTVIPFAFTGGGDKWVWVAGDEDKEYYVALCYHDDFYGVYYAKNMEDAILRHIIEYVSDSNFYVSEDEAESYQISEKELKAQLKNWKEGFRGIIKDEYIDIIEQLSAMSLKYTKCQYREWYSLLSMEEQNELVEKHLYFELQDEEFEWCKA